MTTIAGTTDLGFYKSTERHYRLTSHRFTRYAVPAGRALFALIFLLAAPNHFSAAAIGYAQAQGVPYATLLVPASGVLALLGGLSVLLGFKVRLGAFLLVMFLLPTTLMMHRFWSITDPQQAMVQQIMFMKNVSMLGCALLLTHFGAGPISMDMQHFKARSEATRIP